jgi:hypothetical protein
MRGVQRATTGSPKTVLVTFNRVPRAHQASASMQTGQLTDVDTRPLRSYRLGA